MATETANLNSLYQVKIRGRLQEQECLNIMHFECVSSAGDADVELHLVKVILNCFITTLIPQLSVDYELIAADWKRVSPTLGNEFTTLPATSGQGQIAGDSLPSYCSAVMSIRTNLGGRSGRGRMYIGGIPESASVKSSIDLDGDLWAALLAFALCVVTNFPALPDPTIPHPIANHWSFGVYSRKIGGASIPYGVTGFHGVTSITPDPFLGTTRSRKVGRGS